MRGFPGVFPDFPGFSILHCYRVADPHCQNTATSSGLVRPAVRPFALSLKQGSRESNREHFFRGSADFLLTTAQKELSL